MSIFVDIAQAIVDALDALNRFADGTPGDEQKEATEESMAILAEEILTGARFFDGIDVYQSTTTTTVTQTPTAATFDTQRVIDGMLYDFTPPDNEIIIVEAGQYIVDYQAGFQGGTGDREAFADIRINGVVVGGALTVASWLVGTQSTGSSRALLDLEAGDRVALFVRRAGTAGTVTTLQNATSLSITKAGP